MRLPSVFVALAGIVLLSGCVQSVAVHTGRGLPNSHDAIQPPVLEQSATWLGDGERFAVVTVGSSSCPPVPTSVDAVDDATIAITFERSPNNPCTADLAATTHEFETPDGIPTGGEVTVEVTQEEYRYSLPLGSFPR